jgi:2,4-diaminopentanoate dehydrogenase
MAEKTYKVIQWCTGSIGQISIRHFAGDPAFELVGAYVTSDAKNGKDAGEVAGIDPLGVKCTTSKDEILALDADAVNYAPLYRDFDDMEAILRSGKNIVTPIGFAYPAAREPGEAERLEAACQAGGTSLHGAGIHPGFVGDLAALTFSRLMTRIDQVIITEIVYLREHPSYEMNFPGLGFGRDPIEAVEDPSPLIHTMDSIFKESMAMLAAGLGVEVDEYTNKLEVAVSDVDLEVKSGFIPAGTVAGMHHQWEALSNGFPVILFQSFWRMGDPLTPDWDYGTNKYIIEFKGDPDTRVVLEPTNPDITGDIGFTGRVWTAMSAVNMIPQVVEAPPGIQTHLELPLGTPLGLVRPGKNWA